MTQQVEDFLDCDHHAGAVKLTVPAQREQRTITLKGLKPGTWTLLVLHDENGDGKMKKSMGIPREGFGFSGNPAIRMGPPRAKDVRFDLPAGTSRQQVKIKYIL